MKVNVKDGYPRRDGPIHQHFGLSYDAYFCVPRLALQAMPIWWQRLFVWLANMLPDTPVYTCKRRNKQGRFIKDPWANYRYGSSVEYIHEAMKDNDK